MILLFISVGHGRQLEECISIDICATCTISLIGCAFAEHFVSPMHHVSSMRFVLCSIYCKCLSTHRTTRYHTAKRRNEQWTGVWVLHASDVLENMMTRNSMHTQVFYNHGDTRLYFVVVTVLCLLPQPIFQTRRLSKPLSSSTWMETGGICVWDDKERRSSQRIFVKPHQ